jgi:hypothetical protein
MKYPGLLERGSTGSAVKSVQRRLLKLGYRPVGPRRKELIADGKFESITEEAVVEFQMQNMDRHGDPLKVDGQVGPLTWEALFDVEITELSRPKPRSGKKYRLMAEALGVARSQVGVREVPKDSNKGPKVEKYLASVDMDPGNAWCAAFTYWCVSRAAARLDYDKVPLIKTAWTPSIWTWAKRKECYLMPKDVLNRQSVVDPGSLFLLHGRVNEHTRVKHVGFVESIEGGFANTVEGNTNKGGSREGGGVYRLRRPLASIYRIVTYG